MIRRYLKYTKEKDLYSSRRDENNKELFLLKSNKTSAIYGLISGGTFFLIIIFISLLLFIQSLFLENKNFQLKDFVDAFDKFESEIKEIRMKNKTINLTNKRLIDDLLNIKSGSSIINEISLIIPKFISINSLRIDNGEVEIKASVNQKNGLENINILIIQINQSEFFNSKATKLIQVKESSNNNNENELIKRLNFIIKGELVDNFEEINKNRLNKLGTLGIVKRINMIKDRGLLK